MTVVGAAGDVNRVKGNLQPGAIPGPDLFARRSLRVVLTTSALCLAATMINAVLTPQVIEGVREGANSYSVSAVGYRALVEMLGSAGVPVLSSRRDSAYRSGPRIPLVLLDPPAEVDALKGMLEIADDRGAGVIVVLPKWRWQVDRERPAWVSSVELVQPSVASAVLGAFITCDSDAVVRPQPAQGATVWRGTSGLEQTPSLAWPQLIHGRAVSELIPLVWAEEGILAGQVKGADILIIADPDLLNNAGIAAGENAGIASQLVVGTFAAKSLVFDETLHGFKGSASLLRELLRPPLVWIPLHLVIVLGVLVLVAADRFGLPLRLAPPVAADVSTLVDSTARLIGLADASSQTLSEYWKLTVRRMARDLGLAVKSGDRSTFEGHVALLGRYGRARGAKGNLEALDNEIRHLHWDGCEPRRAVAVARRLYRWRKEVFDGPRRDR
jgi:hypothetical protein